MKRRETIGTELFWLIIFLVIIISIAAIAGWAIAWYFFIEQPKLSKPVRIEEWNVSGELIVGESKDATLKIVTGGESVDTHLFFKVDVLRIKLTSDDIPLIELDDGYRADLGSLEPTMTYTYNFKLVTNLPPEAEEATRNLHLGVYIGEKEVDGRDNTITIKKPET